MIPAVESPQGSAEDSLVVAGTVLSAAMMRCARLILALALAVLAVGFLEGSNNGAFVRNEEG